MKSIYVKDLDKGMTLGGETFAIQEAQLAETKSGKPYYRLTLVDKTGSVSGQIWSDNFDQIEKKALKPGNVVAIEASVDEYRGALQLNISKATGVDESALDEFIEASDHDLDELWQLLEKHIGKIERKDLQEFFAKLFGDKNIKIMFKTRPAAEFVHHSFQGGLLEHVVEMLEMMEPMQQFYPEANYDLVRAGIILHDIGKLKELDIVGTVVQRTTEGHLIGHLIKSYELVANVGKDILEDETMLNLKHIILAHHGRLEYGSPVKPATIEAAMVNVLDEASSGVRIYQKLLRKNSGNDEDFTEYDKILGTRVYKGLLHEQSNDLTEGQGSLL